jgi:hypothetical protein
MSISHKFVWSEIPNQKYRHVLRASIAWVELGSRESDLSIISQWCQEHNCGRRTSYDQFVFKNQQQITMFLLKWA